MASSPQSSSGQKRRLGTNTSKSVGPTIELGGFSTALLSLLVVLLGFHISQIWITTFHRDCIPSKFTARTNKAEIPPPPPEPVVIEKTAVATQEDQQGIVLGSLTPPREPKDKIKEEIEFPPAAKFPPQCTPSQFERLAQQLPPQECVENAEKPWNKRCSFQDKTVCGNANPHWFYDFVQASSSFRGIIVGCNKGVDALQILTKISATNTYNIDDWDKQFAKIPETAKLDSNYECRDPSTEIKTPGRVQDVHLYCIDGAPNTVKQLQSTKQALGYNDELEIVHSIISDQDFFGGLSVKAIDPIGFMGSGPKYWRNQCIKKPEECETAPATNIDTFVKSTPALQAENQPFLQYLKVSAVGSDYFTLKGAAKTLERTQYIDFGYHWNFDWGDTELKDLIYRLKKKGFVCYFTGTSGEALWRITDCWQDHYALKFPASIGCVNANIPEAEPLLDKMEELFQKTLGQGTQS